jgi:catechol 2,3-dioxygenase-like lactoylglutathione lyase family enzyme
MRVKQINHVSFAVRDLARSREFYEGVLGLHTVERPSIGIPGVWYGAGEGQIHLIQTPPGASVGAAPERLTPLANHCAFEIDDYEKFVALLKQRGLPIVETNRELGQLFVQDPDGNVIELIRPR